MTISKTITARRLKLGQLIEDDVYITWWNFQFLILSAIALCKFGHGVITPQREIIQI